MSNEALDRPAAAPSPLDALERWVRDSRSLVVLSGAGCSTESGIPDYRDLDGSWKQRRPVDFRDFIARPAVRRRYWARSLIGWRRVAAASPNAAHRALARLERMGRLAGLITQNVDGLHQRAGSRRVIDLHGRLDAIQCLDCFESSPRAAFQRLLEASNPDWDAHDGTIAPDGDIDPGDVDYDRFRVPPCARCGGIVKPAVVLFGENVPRQRVASALALVEGADALLVVGSSLMVFSGYRFARAAAARGIPLAAINLGRTRADDCIGLKIAARCGEVLSALVARLDAGSPTDTRETLHRCRHTISALAQD